MLKKLKIGPKLIACFCIVVVIASISGVFATVMLKNADKNYSEALVVNGFSQGDIGSFNTYLNKDGAVIRDIIMLTEPSDIAAAQEELKVIRTNIDNALEKMKISCGSEGELAHIKTIESKLPDYRTKSEAVIELGLKNQNDEALALFRSDARPVLNEVMDAAQSLVDLNISMGNEVSQNLSSQTNLTVWLSIFIILASLLISIIFAVVVSKSIAAPIIRVKDAAAQLAEGNLRIDINSDLPDEIGDMTRSFADASQTMRFCIQDISTHLGRIAKGDFTSEFKEAYRGDFQEIQNAIKTIILSLSDTLTQINQSADQVSSGSEQVSSGAQALSQGATEQASSIEELAAAINEISGQVNGNADHARDASTKVNTVKSEVLESNERMQEMLGAMSDISGNSSEISKIIKAIEDIAFQTNILALNAAVEAARAGEAGKGFAVVADEVRSLAGKSAEASKDTSLLIEKSLRSVENGTTIADETAASLRQVVEGVEGITHTINQITEASVTQAGSISQVTLGIDQISSVVQTNSATAEESAAASEELSGQAQMLKNLVSQFKLNSRDGEIRNETESFVGTYIQKPEAQSSYHGSKY